jgi:prepilin-type N-terminal cleavage/methylation domain-containing protein
MMKTYISKTREDGFNLVEVMIVVAIIGLLASVMIPRMEIFVAKAKQAEAKTLLKHVVTLETAYFAEFGNYTNDLPTLGYTTNPQSRWSDPVFTNFTAATYEATTRNLVKICKCSFPGQNSVAANQVGRINTQTPNCHNC